jgi:hypothetical protein
MIVKMCTIRSLFSPFFHRNYLTPSIIIGLPPRVAPTVNSSSSYTFSTKVASTPKSAAKKMGRLTEAERKEQLDPLVANGWSVKTDRDAIAKTFKFKV